MYEEAKSVMIIITFKNKWVRVYSGYQKNDAYNELIREEQVLIFFTPHWSQQIEVLTLSKMSRSTPQTCAHVG